MLSDGKEGKMGLEARKSESKQGLQNKREKGKSQRECAFEKETIYYVVTLMLMLLRTQEYNVGFGGGVM